MTGDRPYLKDVLFFTEKVEGTWEAYAAKNPDAARIQQSTFETHPNTASRIAAASLAVDDLERAKASYSSIGLTPRPERTLPLIDARVSEVPLGTGSLMLAQFGVLSGPSRGPPISGQGTVRDDGGQRGGGEPLGGAEPNDDPCRPSREPHERMVREERGGSHGLRSWALDRDVRTPSGALRTATIPRDREVTHQALP